MLRTVQYHLKRPSVAWKKQSKSRLGLFDFIAAQNIPVETYFILILKTRIARLEGSRVERSKFGITPYVLCKISVRSILYTFVDDA